LHRVPDRRIAASLVVKETLLETLGSTEFVWSTIHRTWSEFISPSAAEEA